MSYGIIRVQKFKATAIRGIQIHDKREKESRTNPDIDKERTSSNYTLQTCDNLANEIEKRIQSLELKKSVRKDAVVMCQALITSDHDFFKDLSKEKQSQFFNKSFEFLQKKFDKYNILSATVHLDEKTPHMHVNFVPVIDGKLSAKELLTPNSLRELQTDFYNEVGKFFGLERGEPRAEKVKHLETEIYKIETRKERLKKLEQSIFFDKGAIKAEDLEPRVLENRFLRDVKETKEDIARRLENEFVKPHYLENKDLKEELKQKDSIILKLKNENKILQKNNTNYNNLLNDFNYLFDYRYLSSKSKNQLKEIAHVFSIRDDYDRRTFGQKKGEYNPIYGTFADYLKYIRNKKQQQQEEQKPLREKLYDDFTEKQKQGYEKELQVLKFNTKRYTPMEYEKEKEKLNERYFISEEKFLSYLLEQNNNSKEFLLLVKEEEKKIKEKKIKEEKDKKLFVKGKIKGLSL